MISLYVKLKSKLKLFALGFCILSAPQVMAQINVTGQVKSGAEDIALPGVNVVVKGTSTGTITDMDGKYAITVPDKESVLVFSMMGMLTEEVVVGDQTVIDVILVEDLIGLDEVVVVGYGTMKKSDLTGSIVSIDEDQMHETKSNNVLESWQGKAAGVDIQRSSGRSGAGVDILIRGNRSLTASNEPLIIVDGVPFGSEIDIDPMTLNPLKFLKMFLQRLFMARGVQTVL
ncbi:MAG: carboxypeptidase-like regulatory domain-containing protein [Bacteroidota bacterium]